MTSDAGVAEVAPFFERGRPNVVASWHHGRVLNGMLAEYRPADESESADLDAMRQLVITAGDPWSRALPLHFTASALVVHPDSRRVLLRWHAKLGRWLQVGGHADPGETDPLTIALREAREETGLTDLVPWPDARLLQVVRCEVPASAAEPAHAHADLRFLFATRRPEAIAAEDERSPLRWLTVPEARDVVGANNLSHALNRLDQIFGAH
jgi:8-oxo-dGTP pyrophosphatase MutT (NUDIX family)